MNSISLGGRLVKDPETGYTQNNKNWTKFTLAINRPFVSGMADFFECMAYGTTATYASKYFRKGDYVALSGSIAINTYQEKKYITVTCATVEKVSSKKDSYDTDSAIRELNNNGAFDDTSNSEEVSDDDLPF